jgi:flagellar biosynthesis/type III secretory pathway protein FliH
LRENGTDAKRGKAEAKPFDYVELADAPFVPCWKEWSALPDEGTESGGRAAAPDPGIPGRPAEEMERLLAAARAQGAEEGRRREREAHAAAEAAGKAQQARQLAALIEKFAAERDRSLRALEEEIVRLALAIAARVLRREAQTDPLLLLGAARVALGQVAACSEVRLRVPAADLELWTAALALLPHHMVKPAVAAGEGMRLGDCVIETSLGTADLGVRAQLGEIEHGLLAGRGEAGNECAAPHPGAGEAAG